MPKLLNEYLLWFWLARFQQVQLKNTFNLHECWLPPPLTTPKYHLEIGTINLLLQSMLTQRPILPSSLLLL